MGSLIHVATLVLGFRQIIKVFDFEEIKDTFEPFSVYNRDTWNRRCTLQIWITHMFIGLNSKSFKRSIIGDIAAFTLIASLSLGINSDS
jgi:hypothetical protein